MYERRLHAINSTTKSSRLDLNNSISIENDFKFRFQLLTDSRVAAPRPRMTGTPEIWFLDPPSSSSSSSIIILRWWKAARRGENASRAVCAVRTFAPVTKPTLRGHRGGPAGTKSFAAARYYILHAYTTHNSQACTYRY